MEQHDAAEEGSGGKAFAGVALLLAVVAGIYAVIAPSQSQDAAQEVALKDLRAHQEHADDEHSSTRIEIARLTERLHKLEYMLEQLGKEEDGNEQEIRAVRDEVKAIQGILIKLEQKLLLPNKD